MQQLPKELSAVEVRLLSLVGTVYSGHNLSTWAYSAQTKKRHYSSALHENELELFFREGKCYEYAFETAREFQTPFIMSNAGGMVWLGEYATMEIVPEQPFSMLVLIGPAFYSNTPTIYPDSIVQYLIAHNYIQPQEAELYRSILHDIPVVTPQTMVAYARMLHFTITNLPLASSSVHYQNSPLQNSERGASGEDDWISYDRVYNQEELILQCVREGDLNYHTVMDDLNSSLLGIESSNNPWQKAMNWLVSCAAHCSRAAIEGGLSPQIAISMRNNYLNRAESLNTPTELLSLTQNMLDDYVRHVHASRRQADLTAYIQECCEYIRAHITEELTIQKIAAEIGYTKYYLARKFQKEMGIRLLDYIKNVRIEYAKVSLLSTEKSVQQISDLLQFSTRNHFTRVFREVTGMTPSEFRNDHHNASN